MSLCIVQGLDNPYTSSFVRAHVELLAGSKVALTGYYPNLTFGGRQIRYFYGRKPRLKKLAKLLPQWLYHRWVTRWEESFPGRHDAIAGFMRSHGVDVVLAEFGVHGANITPHARDLGLPLIVHFHGHDAHRTPIIEDYRDRYRDMFDYAFRVVSVSPHMTEALKRLGAPADKIVLNPYGPRADFFKVQPAYRKTIVALGRFTDIKAPYLTLLAFRDAVAHHPDARLVMAGDGELLETCRTLARTVSLEDRVEFPGPLHHDEVRKLMAQGCCFAQHSVTTSYGDGEGTPVAILEAGAAGLPVVATRHAGITDAVRHGETGYLVDERDVAGMAHYFDRLLGDTELSKSLGAAAREHIRHHFGIERHIACLDNLVKEARKFGV